MNASVKIDPGRTAPPAVLEVGAAVELIDTGVGSEVAVTVAAPLEYPALVVRTVSVDEVTGATFATVTSPFSLMETEPEGVTVPVHEYESL